MLLLSLFVSHSVLANSEQNLFNCMNKDNLEIDSACMEQTIEQHPSFIHTSFEIKQSTAFLGENAIATMRFFPEQRLIQVIANVQFENEKVN
jgi:hypothetical protein